SRASPGTHADGVTVRDQRRGRPPPRPRLLPVAHPPPRSHPAAEAELLRQMLPADPRMQHEQDPLQYEPIIQRLATRITKPARLLRQHRLDPRPCLIRDLPRLRPHRHPPELDDGCRRTSLPPSGSLHSVRGSDMEQTVKGATRQGLSSRPGAVERPEQRRWIRLTFAGRDRMTGNRRELPLSKVAGHRPGLAPHRACEGSPCGWTHPLLEVERLVGQMFLSGCSVAIAQTKPASSRAQATTIFWWGLPRPAIPCQPWYSPPFPPQPPPT